MINFGRAGQSRLRGALGGAGLVLLAGIQVPAAASAAPVAPAPPGSAFAVATGPGDQTDPHVSGDLVTYTDNSVPPNYAGTPSQIRFRNLATGTDGAIPRGDGEDSLSAVSGTTIAYVHFGPRGRSIYTYDTATAGPPVELDPQANSNRRRVSISPTTIAWQDFGYSALVSPEIVAYDRATGRTTRLTDDSLYDSDPSVDPSGTVITWTKCTSIALGCDVWDATRAGSAWTVRQLTNDSAEESTPATNGAVVVYSSDRGGDVDLRWQPVAGGPEQLLAIAGSDDTPRITGNLVTFEHYQLDDPTPEFQVYAVDLSTRTFYRLSNDPARYTEGSDISTGADGTIHVVWSGVGWEGDTTYSENVYGYSFVRPGTDAVAPAIAISSPGDQATYSVNQTMAAAYTCIDEAGGSGTASCQGSVPVGAAVDTATAGAKTFTVNASDNAGNTSTKTVGYTVSYRICALFDQTRSYRIGSTVPVKLQLCDANGANVSTAATAVSATTLIKKDSQASPNLATASGNANPDNNFRYDSSQGGYIYNLSTKGLATGTWVLSFTVSGDPTMHIVQFDLR